MSEAYGMIEKLELIRAACGCRLPAYESRTLIVLASLINGKTGCAYPAQSLLADLTNIDVRHVYRALKSLEQRGLLAITEAGTKRRATRYSVNVEALLTAGRPASAGVSDPPLQACQTHLYRWVKYKKRQAKGNEAASGSRCPSLFKRSQRGRVDPRATTKPKRNAWLKNYQKPPPKPPLKEVAD
jgi:hypothetical protein